MLIQAGSLPYEYADNLVGRLSGGNLGIWAANPWRIHWDMKNDRLSVRMLVNTYEKVNLITKGGNYGWNIREELPISLQSLFQQLLNLLNLFLNTDMIRAQV